MTDFLKFFKEYTQKLSHCISSISNRDLKKMNIFFDELIKNKKTLFVAGNGGSASTAGTFANDLGSDIFKKTNKKLFNIRSLVDNVSIITAISNDTGYDNLFLNQLKIYHKIGDPLLLISASGNSKNLIKAAKFAKKRKGKIISFVGFDGGKLKNLSNICIHVKTKKNEYGPVEDAHLILNHVLAHWYQNKFK